MTPLPRLPFLLLGSTLLLLLGWRLAAAPAGTGAAPAVSGPVVVELFTSQGCSSCPPADRLLTQLGRDPRLAGRVVPLAFHVDYWNHIGWQDPFSSPRWSARQQAYARAFGSNRIYTPQLVVGGRSECVGSEEGQARRAIGTALGAEPAGQVSLAVATPSPGGHLHVMLGAKLVRPAGKGDLDLWVAIYETGLTTPVKAGENAARTLHDDYVVRRLDKAFSLPPAVGTERTAEMTVELDRRWKVAEMGVAAFLQDPATLAIHGAAARRLGGR
jgi:hypothetical protein